MLTVTELSKEFVRHKQREKQKSRFSFGKKSAHSTVSELFFAVNQVSFTAEKGEILGILGPNGAGKTTLLRMLGGILTPTSGEIRLNGVIYDDDNRWVKKQIGYLSGNTKLYGRLSPRELLELLGNFYQMDKSSVRQSVHELSVRLNLTPFMDNRIETLSTGQTQRVSIARCLLHNPDLYILDEPTLGLDVLGSRSILEFMKEERNLGKTVLYSTHYMEEAETLCDRIIMIHEGKILSEGTPKELKERFSADSLRDVFFAMAEDVGEEAAS